MDPNQITYAARKELAEEFHRKAVDAEKARIRARMDMSLWTRFLAWLPFTLTWKKS